MAIAFRAATTAGNATGGSLTINKPTGVVDNDILILTVYSEGGASSITPPTGFTQLGTTQANAGTAVMWLGTYWKRAASEGASYSIGISPSAWRVASLAAFSGCTTSGSPVDTFTSHGDTNTAVTAASITTTVANAMVVVTMGNFSGTDQTAGTSGMTLASGGNLGGCDTFYVIQASAGATGTKTFSPGQGVASQDVVYTLDLMPPSGNVTVTPTAAAAGGVGAAPAVTTGSSATVSPTAAAAGGASPAATVSVGTNATVTVSAPAASGASGIVPTITTTQNPTVTPTAASAGAAGTLGTAGATPPAHLTSIGNGYTDATPKQVTRTSDNRLWVSSWQFDTYPQGSANGLTQTLRMYKADQTGTPSTFTRMDSAHEDAGVVSWSMAVGASDLIHVVYTVRASWNSGTNIGTDNVLKYNTFNPSTGLWGTPVSLETALAVTEIGQGDELVALAVDSAGAPHVVYLKSDGTRRRVNYINKASGSWSSPVIVDDQTFGSNEKCWHPGIAFDNAGRIVVTWIRGDFNGNGTGRLFMRVNTSGTWGTTHDVAGANVWIGIDTDAPVYIDSAGRYHITYLDGSVNEYFQYRYSDNQGATWTSNHPGGGTAQGHNPVIGPGTSGGVRIYGHAGATTEITYFQGAGGSGAWGTRTDYETPTGYDCSVNVRWSQYFWWYPSTLDVVYWKSDYPTNGLVTGLDMGGTDVYLAPAASAAGAGLAAPVVNAVSVTVSPSAASAGGSSPAPAVAGGTGVTVSPAAAASGARAASPAVGAGAGVSPSAASAGAGASAPGVAGGTGATVSPAAAAAGSSAPAPIISVGINATVSPSAAAAGGAGNNPTISATKNATVLAPVIGSGAGVAAPGVSGQQSVTVSAPAIGAGGAAPSPIISTGFNVTVFPAPARAGAGALAAAVGAGAGVFPWPGSAGGAGFAPLVTTTQNPNILAAPAMAGGVAPAPVVFVIAPFYGTVKLSLAPRSPGISLAVRRFTLAVNDRQLSLSVRSRE